MQWQAMVDSGLQPEHAVYLAMLRAESTCGSMDVAVEVAERWQATEQPELRGEIWSSLLLGAAANKRPDIAIAVEPLLPSKDIPSLCSARAS